MEDGLWPWLGWFHQCSSSVLILIWMEDGLWQDENKNYCIHKEGLNPCFNGRWSLIRIWKKSDMTVPHEVLILVLMEDGLWYWRNSCQVNSCLTWVLILVLMEDGLWCPCTIYERFGWCLNPCFNGRWSLIQSSWVLSITLNLS